MQIKEISLVVGHLTEGRMSQLNLYQAWAPWFTWL